MTPQYLPVHLGIHLGVGGDKVDVAEFGVAERGPDHELGRVLNSPQDEVGVVPRDGGGAADSPALLRPLPLFYVGFIRPQHLRPLGAAPPGVLLGPGQAPGLLEVGQEWLLGGKSAGDLQLAADDVLDCSDFDVAKAGNLLLEAESSDEWVSFDLLLDLFLQRIRHLAVLGSRARIKVALGRPGHAAVSTFSDPVPGLDGGFPPVVESIPGDVEALRDQRRGDAGLHHVQCGDFRRVAPLRSGSLLSCVCLLSCSWHG